MAKTILIVDTYYPDFLKSQPRDVTLQQLLDRQFGTADFYSRNLRALGWDARDVIANCAHLPEPWWAAYYTYRPRCDVLFIQDLSLMTTLLSMKQDDLKQLKKHLLLAAQCSCPWPGDEEVRQFDVIFTSFPHYVKRIEALGVKAVYNPLAFEPSVLTDPQPRIHDVVFIGGVGAQWSHGMETLHAVAEAIPTFQWWGYGADQLPRNSALRQKYQGEAWGRDMYAILQRSKICLNRHIDAAEGYANNMRMFEATGCGALLLTEAAPNIRDFFEADQAASYRTPEEAIDLIDYYLKTPSHRESIARNGQLWTLQNHTYAQRMKTIADALTAALETPMPEPYASNKSV